MKKNFFYRFIVLLVVFSLVGAILLTSLAAVQGLSTSVFWIIFGSYLGLFVVVVVVNEILVHKKKAKEKQKQ